MTSSLELPAVQSPLFHAESGSWLCTAGVKLYVKTWHSPAMPLASALKAPYVTLFPDFRLTSSEESEAGERQQGACPIVTQAPVAAVVVGAEEPRSLPGSRRRMGEDGWRRARSAGLLRPPLQPFVSVDPPTFSQLRGLRTRSHQNRRPASLPAVNTVGGSWERKLWTNEPIQPLSGSLNVVPGVYKVKALRSVPRAWVTVEHCIWKVRPSEPHRRRLSPLVRPLGWAPPCRRYQFICSVWPRELLQSSKISIFSYLFTSS